MLTLPQLLRGHSHTYSHSHYLGQHPSVLPCKASNLPRQGVIASYPSLLSSLTIASSAGLAHVLIRAYSKFQLSSLRQISERQGWHDHDDQRVISLLIQCCCNCDIFFNLAEITCVFLSAQQGRQFVGEVRVRADLQAWLNTRPGSSRMKSNSCKQN